MSLRSKIVNNKCLCPRALIRVNVILQECLTSPEHNNADFTEQLVLRIRAPQPTHVLQSDCCIWIRLEPLKHARMRTISTQEQILKPEHLLAT